MKCGQEYVMCGRGFCVACTSVKLRCTFGLGYIDFVLFGMHLCIDSVAAGLALAALSAHRRE